MQDIKPQPGPQTAFLSSSADVVIFGGAAGSSKTFSLLMDAARHIDNSGYAAIIFRRTSPQITAPGALWDTSGQIYPLIDGHPRSHVMEWSFESGATVGFRHLQHENDKYAYQGSQICFIAFDELSHFSESIFWYLFSRSRSSCGIRPTIRATTNPVHPDDETAGWVARLIAWWIDWETGYPIQERSGVIRWFIRRSGELIWGESKQELIDKYGDPDLSADHENQSAQPKSFTFIPAKLSDNPALTSTNPDYKASLMALPEHEMKALLYGNWLARIQAGTFYKIGVMSQEGMIIPRESLPKGFRYVRCWDLAHTEGAGDWTVGILMATDGDGNFWIVDIVRVQMETFGRDDRIAITAEIDDADKLVPIRLPQDPSAGKSEAARMVRELQRKGHLVKAVPESGSKEVRQAKFAKEFNGGKVKLVKGNWNSGFLQRLDAFPTKGIPDDEGDACCGAIAELASKKQLKVGTGADQEEKRPPMNSYEALKDDHVRSTWERIIREEPVCPQWKGSFANFRDDIGQRPSDAHMLRLRSELEMWQPSNVAWVLPGEVIEVEKPLKKRFIVG